MKKLALSAIILFLYLSSHAQFEKIEREIGESLTKTETIGLAVAVIKNNQLVYQHAFGKKNVEDSTPLSNSDIFRIASISKSFAATSMMQLAEAKKLSLDDDFGNLVGFKIRNPKFPETVITLRMVLSHTSSINDSQGYFNLDVINPSKNPNWEKCYTDKQPGISYLYCNLNFNMAGAVIERITGQRYDSYVKQHILAPLNVYGGYCIDSLDAKRFATLYEYENKAFKPSPAAYAPRREELSTYQLGYSTPILSPTGGMKISATDLATYMTMHMNYGKANGVRIIAKKSAKQMQTPLSSPENYGLALLTTNKLISGKTLVGHTGSAYGLYSAMFFDPKEKFGIVVITNGTSAKETDGYKAIIKESFNILYQNLIAK
ncbi:serine hydrolase domain-containing protein [Pedobacter chitinilyticus]|uniref:Class A beta-lactamase-related serine hydrolase n=1 Tax=Pedobacter chitinilyticus TaxID=2233776 RepID=A0A443YJU5_9SPHI|nr:serine hydrolase domain-containing protein [Pedobacter chitinilyticus]RWU04020.1 class A beta-lactamase-related serine hydrolase [Pedobacter chitinilyticus]